MNSRGVGYHMSANGAGQVFQEFDTVHRVRPQCHLGEQIIGTHGSIGGAGQLIQVGQAYCLRFLDGVAGARPAGRVGLLHLAQQRQHVGFEDCTGVLLDLGECVGDGVGCRYRRRDQFGKVAHWFALNHWRRSLKSDISSGSAPDQRGNSTSHPSRAAARLAAVRPGLPSVMRSSSPATINWLSG